MKRAWLSFAPIVLIAVLLSNYGFATKTDFAESQRLALLSPSKSEVRLPGKNLEISAPENQVTKAAFEPETRVEPPIKKTDTSDQSLLLGEKPAEFSESKEPTYSKMGVQVGTTWALDRLDGQMDGQFSYLGDGSGVTVFVVDTGIDSLHPEFEGRVQAGFDAFGENLSGTDCDGHGTHIAGLIAGKYFGVAKEASLVSVRVLDCNGVGTLTSLLAGVDWILANLPSGPSVANFSLGGPKNEAIDEAISKLRNRGVFVTVAAGNSGKDACNYSPSGAPGAFTFSASDFEDARASFSNSGICVDLMAPGVNINSAKAGEPSFSLKMSGTSQASALGAGAAASLLSSSPSLMPSEVAQLLIQDSTETVVTVRRDFQLVSQPIGDEVSEPVSPEASPISDPEESPSTPPEPEPEPEDSQPDEQYFVRVVQSEPGSTLARLEWSPVDGASGYDIYKTGSIRPYWRIFWRSGPTASYRTVSDSVDAIAVYRVIAKVGGSRILLGEYTYFPAP